MYINFIILWYYINLHQINKFHWFFAITKYYCTISITNLDALIYVVLIRTYFIKKFPVVFKCPLKFIPNNHFPHSVTWMIQIYFVICQFNERYLIDHIFHGNLYIQLWFLNTLSSLLVFLIDPCGDHRNQKWVVLLCYFIQVLR